MAVRTGGAPDFGKYSDTASPSACAWASTPASISAGNSIVTVIKTIVSLFKAHALS
jgi:hypothetical protein